MSAVEEAEWAVEVLKQVNTPIAATISIGPHGDANGVSVEECAVRLAKAGKNTQKWIQKDCNVNREESFQSI